MGDTSAAEDEALSIAAMWRQTVAVTGDRSVARWLCETAVGLDGDEFIAAQSEPVTERMIQHLDAMVGRYLGGEPVQYVLGRWGFRTLDLAIDPRVLIPRPETEWVAGRAIALAAARHRRTGSVRVIDLGTGSGAIGLSLAAELPLVGVEVWMSDIDSDALDIARANSVGLGRRASAVRIIQGSWFDAVASLDRHPLFDVIVANPPYIAEGSIEVEAAVRDHEPARALFSGPDGLDALRSIVADAPGYLEVDGWLVLEIGSDQGAAVERLLIERGFIEVGIEPDPAGHDRIASARWPDNVRG
jgi:release factor glutamine methyltransferase